MKWLFVWACANSYCLLVLCFVLSHFLMHYLALYNMSPYVFATVLIVLSRKKCNATVIKYILFFDAYTISQQDFDVKKRKTIL